MPLLEHAQELAARGPAGAHVEMLESEVRALGVAQEDPPLERQALARGVGDGEAQPGVLQEGGVGEGVAAVQDDLLGAHFGHVHVDALGDAAAGPDELQAGPDPHGLWHVGGRRAGAGVLDRDSFRRGQAAVVEGIDADAAGVGDDEAHVRLALSRKPFPGRLECLGQGLLPGLVDPEPGQEAKNARVAPHVLRELVVPAAGEVVEQLAVLELPLHRGAREVVHDGGELAEVAEQQELDFPVHGDAGDVVPQPRVQLCDLFRHQPVDVAVPVPDGAPCPVVGRLRLHAEVLHGGVGLRDDLDLVPFFPEGGHDLARQVGFPGARVARQQQAFAFEAVEHGVPRDLPVRRAAIIRTLGLDSGDPVLALEALDLLAPVHGRAVGVFLADQAVHKALELFGQDAVRFNRLQVPRRHGGERVPDAADRDVLRGHHEVVHGPTAPVGQQLGHVDVVPVHPARGVQEQLPVLAAGAVELVVAGAHGVDEVHVARPEPDEGVHRQLRVVLLSLRPGRLHLLQGLGHGLLVHVRCGVQAPHEVVPGRDALFKHVGRRGLGVPAFAHVGEPREGRPAPVLRELHVGQVRQVPLAGWLHVVLGAEDGCRELGMGQGVLAAPDHVYSVADPLRLVAVELEDQRGQPGRFHVGLVSPPAEAGLQRRGVRELQGRFVPVALEAQGLQILGLCGEGLVHGDDVVQLARPRGDGRRAELALVVLLREHGLPRPGRIPARLEKVKEDLARRARQALPAIGEPQPAHPGLQHLQVLVEGADDAVLAAAHSQAQAPPLAHAPHDHLGAVPLSQELPPDLLQVLGVEVTAADLALPLPPVLELRRFAWLPLAPVFGVGPVPDRLAPRDGAGGFVEEGVAVPAREGHGPLLLDRRLELVQQAALAVHVEHRGLAPDAEGSDLSGRDALLLPLASDAGDCVEVREHLLNRQPHQLRKLPGDAELVRPLFEGGLEDLVAAKQLVGDVPQGPEGLVQDGVHHHLVVHDLHGLLAEVSFFEYLEKIELYCSKENYNLGIFRELENFVLLF